MTRTRLWPLALCAALASALAACNALDTDRGAEAWQPKGLNAANLAVMVQDPADLIRGRSDPGPVRNLSTRAVLDLWRSPTSPLPQGPAVPGGNTPSAAPALTGGATPSAGTAN
jgi:hypothetical protein